MRRWVAAVGLTVWLFSSSAQADVSYEERSTAGKALLNVAAAFVNVTPVLSAFWAKRCLPGYLVCKTAFAGMSLILAGEHVLMSGAEDMQQTNAILRRGFGGDWFVTGRHVNGDLQVQPWPDAAPAAASLP